MIELVNEIPDALALQVYSLLWMSSSTRSKVKFACCPVLFATTSPLYSHSMLVVSVTSLVQMMVAFSPTVRGGLSPSILTPTNRTELIIVCSSALARPFQRWILPPPRCHSPLNLGKASQRFSLDSLVLYQELIEPAVPVSICWQLWSSYMPVHRRTNVQ